MRWMCTYSMKILGLLLLFTFQFLLVPAQPNYAARYEIDAKRVGVEPTSKDALPRSREFIRLDSTYYVGYMFEGMYKADKSSDHPGFKHAIPALRKSFSLFRKDYGQYMQTLFAAPENYTQHITRYVDLLQIANNLKECYDNLEMADSVMWVLDEIDKYNFPKEHFTTNTTKAWTYHRNRFYTSEKFSFLKNSVEENEQMAFSFCYRALANIEMNRAQNDVWFGTGQDEYDKQSVYHYLALLHAYNKNYDSSEYYYLLQVDAGAISWNNYGNMKHELAELAVAYEYINRDRYRSYQKHLREPYYFIPILDVYAGRTRQAMAMCKEAIEYAGSTPGFGWYNIALARSYLYDGQLDSAEHTLNKAAAFREMHIGTTLTQAQYDFTISLLRLQLTDRKIAIEKFLNKGWWYSLSTLYKIMRLKIEKLMQQYVLVNQLAANPERDRTVYDLFCSEATTTWDEAYYLVKDFSPKYFIRKYRHYTQNDPRQQVTRYFRLFTHQLQWENGDEDDAYRGYNQLAREVKLDIENEKLFLARLYEGMNHAARDEGNEQDEQYYAHKLYETYPQLAPYTSIRPNVRLTISGNDDDITRDVVDELKSTGIAWADKSDRYTANAALAFTRKGNKYEISYSVTSAAGKQLVAQEKMVIQKPDGAGKEIALRLFGKGGPVVFDHVAVGDER